MVRKFSQKLVPVIVVIIVYLGVPVIMGFVGVVGERNLLLQAMLYTV
jgi:hypothetical protein